MASVGADEVSRPFTDWRRADARSDWLCKWGTVGRRPGVGTDGSRQGRCPDAGDHDCNTHEHCVEHCVEHCNTHEHEHCFGHERLKRCEFVAVTLGVAHGDPDARCQHFVERVVERVVEPEPCSDVAGQVTVAEATAEYQHHPADGQGDHPDSQGSHLCSGWSLPGR